ncbi:MAG: hypothetical protein CL912_04830 [Deltaproteobacteria bacterium]|nr:hypothetical protein [Deltaproteobacteria bacterium]
MADAGHLGQENDPFRFRGAPEMDVIRTIMRANETSFCTEKYFGISHSDVKFKCCFEDLFDTFDSDERYLMTSCCAIRTGTEIWWRQCNIVGIDLTWAHSWFAQRGTGDQRHKYHYHQLRNMKALC